MENAAETKSMLLLFNLSPEWWLEMKIFQVERFVIIVTRLK